MGLPPAFDYWETRRARFANRRQYQAAPASKKFFDMAYAPE